MRLSSDVCCPFAARQAFGDEFVPVAERRSTNRRAFEARSPCLPCAPNPRPLATRQRIRLISPIRGPQIRR
jgi:hypothetical protein